MGTGAIFVKLGRTRLERMFTMFAVTMGEVESRKGRTNHARERESDGLIDGDR